MSPHYSGLPLFNLSQFQPHPSTLHLLSEELIFRYRIIPLKKEGDILKIGTSDPANHMAIDTVTFHTGLTVMPVLVEEEALNQFIEKHYNFIKNEHLKLTALKNIIPDENIFFAQENNINYDEPIIQFVDHLLHHAQQKAASDIHIEPYEDHCRIRYRQDGILYKIAEIQHHLASRIITRLKVMSHLDISEHRLPQDGRIQSHARHPKNRDIRISICPMLYGEKIVLRLMDNSKMTLALHSLGLTKNQQCIFLEKISQPQGLILVTGPTGSGKTMTLYSVLHYLNTPEKNISTVEDPVEIPLIGINQVHINAKTGLDFAVALRAFLRQDPDIMMVGEIRDGDTAKIAIQAAQTGHLILASLHTNNAIETLFRLMSMGIEPYQLIHSLSLIVAQRLVRKLCSHCKREENIPERALSDLGFNSNFKGPFYRAHGCSHCRQGYQGRTGIFECLPLTEPLALLMMKNADVYTLIKTAQEEGLTLLKEAGLEKVIQGETSIAELCRVLRK